MRNVRTLALLTLTLAVAAPAPAEPRFRVLGRKMATVYFDAGRAQGLQVGDRVQVLRGPTVVGEMAIVALNENAAACRVLSQTRPIGEGDVVVPVVRDAKRAREAARTAEGVGGSSTVAHASPETPPPTPKANSNGPAATPVPPKPATPPEPSPATPRAGSNGPAPAPAKLLTPPEPPPAAPKAAPPPPASPPRAASAAAAPTVKSKHVPATPEPSPAKARPRATAPAQVNGRRFKVKYRSANNAYLEAGRAEGLEVGDRLRILDGVTTVAELEIAFVADLSASCKVLSETRPVRAGDVAVGLGAAGARRPGDGGAATTPTTTTTATAVPAETALASTTSAVGEPSRTAWGRLRGAASVGYYRSWDKKESALDYQQRTARLNLGLYDIAGQPLSFTLRARSRQDVRARALSLRTPMDERTDRLYELALRYEPPSDRVAFELGRIGMYRFVGIGYLDGGLVRFRPRPGLQLGIFGGRLAEIQSLGFSSPGGKYGAFVRLVPSGRYVRSGYDVLLAYSRENADGDISREYLSLESSFGNGSRWSLFQRAELDLNRGWRQEVTGKGYQFSNLSFSGNLRVSGSTWAFLSYDGRRNYRYYRNRIVPEEVFDDLLHQGLRAGVNIAKPGGFGASAGFGMSLKEPDRRHPELNIANAYSFNAGVRHSNLFSSGLSAGLNGSGFTNGYADGGLLSAHLGWYLPRGHMLDFSYGYSLYHVTQTGEDRNTEWLRFVGRAHLTRWLYLLGDLGYDAGDDLEGPRVFLELGVLF
jgi:hypothetical protein